MRNIKINLAIILVNYNNYIDTCECVDSILHNKMDFVFRIIIVDNKSTNASFDFINKKYRNNIFVQVLSTSENKGFAYGNNYGITFARKTYNPSYYLCINNDTLIPERMIQKLFDEYKKYFNNILNQGLATGKIYFYSEPNRIWYAGGYLSKIKCAGVHYRYKNIDSNLNGKRKTITFVSGCFMYFHSSLINSVGLMEESLFMYYEDVDYSFRIAEKNIECVYFPEVYIYHKIGASYEEKEYPYFYPNRNRIYIARKYLKKVQFASFGFLFLISRILIILKRFICGEQKVTDPLSGVFQGFFGANPLAGSAENGKQL